MPYKFYLRCRQRPRHNSPTVKRQWQIIADNLSKAGFSWGCSSETESSGRVVFTADAYAGDGRRFTVLANERLTAFLELEAAIRRQRGKRR